MFELIDLIIVRPIVNILFLVYNFIGDFGLAIIIFTVIVKILMWPLIKRQLYQAKLMRKVQPELAEIKKNCKGNRQLESLQMLDLYKRHNIKPFRQVLTLFIQLPIYIALFTAIRVIVQPTVTDNLSSRAYSFIRPLDRVNDIISKQATFLTDPSTGYDFHPQLFGVIDLDVRSGLTTPSAIAILFFALSAAIVQYWMAKQQLPSKNTKKRSLKQIFKEAATGKEPDQAELNNMVSSQMTILMPVMMFLIMYNLPGALVFYYLLTNIITVIQQKIIFDKDTQEMEVIADKAIIKELNKIKEAKVIENKKTGTKITRISAKDQKRSKK